MTLKSRIPGYDDGTPYLPWISPYLRHCGESLRGPWHIGKRTLLDYLLVYIDEGRGRFIVNQDDFEVSSGDLIFIPPQTEHEMWGFPPKMFCTYLHFDLIYRETISHWDFSIPGGMTDLSELNSLQHPPIPPCELQKLQGKLNLPNTERIANWMHDICHEAFRGGPYASLRISGMLTCLCADILTGLREAEVPILHGKALEKAAKILRSDLLINITHVARHVGISPSHFRKLFHRYFGCSPRRYQVQARIQKAKQLLMAGELSIQEIAKQTGFSSVYSFSRTFSREVQCSPLQYRQLRRPVIRVEGLEPYLR